MDKNRHKLKGAHELRDLDVDRVDAVDHPATGRHFFLFKSKDGKVAAVGKAPIIIGKNLQDEEDEARLEDESQLVDVEINGKRGRMPLGEARERMAKARAVQAEADRTRQVGPEGDAQPVGKSRFQAGEERGSIFADTLLGPVRKVAESAVCEYEPGEDKRPKGGVRDEDSSAEDREVARFNGRLNSWNGKAQDATRRPAWAKDSLLHGDMHADEGDAFDGVTSFSDVRDSDATRRERRPDRPNFAPGGEHGMPESGTFRAPQPGKLRRVGDTYVSRRRPEAEVVGVNWYQAEMMRRCGYEVGVEKSAREEKPGAQGGRFSVSFGNLLD